MGAPLVENVTRWADRHRMSVIGFTWNAWPLHDNVLVKDAKGTPTDGYGKVFRAWLRQHRR